MLFAETVAVYCDNNTEHTDTVRTSQETHYVSTTEPNRLMLFGETVAVYCLLEREREREREKSEFEGGGSERHCQDVGGSEITKCVWKVPRRCPLVLLVG
jgi:hypothetical protein